MKDWEQSWEYRMLAFVILGCLIVAGIRKALQGALVKLRPFLPMFSKHKSENVGVLQMSKCVSSGLLNFTLQSVGIGERAAHYTLMGA